MYRVVLYMMTRYELYPSILVTVGPSSVLRVYLSLNKVETYMQVLTWFGILHVHVVRGYRRDRYRFKTCWFGRFIGWASVLIIFGTPFVLMLFSWVSVAFMRFPIHTRSTTVEAVVSIPTQ